jgi:hypothetical protein
MIWYDVNEEEVEPFCLPSLNFLMRTHQGNGKICFDFNNDRHSCKAAKQIFYDWNKIKVNCLRVCYNMLDVNINKLNEQKTIFHS